MVNDPAPEGPEVAAVIRRVLDGEMSREDAADWAMRWVSSDDAQVEDFQAWHVLVVLSGIAERTAPDHYFFSEKAIRSWLDDLPEY